MNTAVLWTLIATAICTAGMAWGKESSMSAEIERVPILLDTDIGNDIDDAVTLAYLLNQPRCQLLGITTVSGEAAKRKALTEWILEAAGRTDIPVFSGQDAALMGDTMINHCPQAPALPAGRPITASDPGEAVRFMSRTIRANPGKVTLLAIGPLTNVALLFLTDPEAAKLLDRLVLMNGRFHNSLPWLPLREWNVENDPLATAIAWRAPVRQILSVGIDTTVRVSLPRAENEKRFIGPVWEPVKKMAEIWYKATDQITYHDPLAAVSIFEPGLCKWEVGKVEVEIGSERVSGITHWYPNAEPKTHTVSSDVDARRFFEHFFSVFR